MNEIVKQIAVWADYLKNHPLIAAGVVLVAVAFYVVSSWKPRHTRDAENRLREIREESHDFYRNMRPPGR